MKYCHLVSPVAIALVALAMLTAAPALNAQEMATDKIPVRFKYVTKFVFPDNGGCNVYVYGIGIHPDPKGNGRDADYTYSGYIGGRKETIHASNDVAPDLGPSDEPGKFITFTGGMNWSLSGDKCNEDIAHNTVRSAPNIRQYASYTMPVGVHGFFNYTSDGLTVCFNASNSFVMTKDGRQPITRYSWDFGDGNTDPNGSANPCHTYSTMAVQYPTLTVYDDKGNSDTYDDIIPLTEGALTSETSIDIQVAGKRSLSAQAQSSMTVQLGDTLTVTGIIKNTGMAEVRNVEALPMFMFFSDYPDSLLEAIIKPLVLTRVPKDYPPMAMRASLAPGDTMQVVRRYVFEKMAQYKMKDADPYQDIPFRIKPSLVYAQGINTKGDTIRAEDHCHGITPDQPVLCAEDYITLGPKVISGADNESKMPGAFALHVAYPNPFNRTTTLTLAMPEAGDATVTVHDIMGQQVAVLLDGRLQAGNHTVLFDAGNLANGVYLVQARTTHGTQIQSVRLQP